MKRAHLNERRFIAPPDVAGIHWAWPTNNHLLHDDPSRFFARTRANPLYGQPGWTRDCGRQFHRGCDIAPAHFLATGVTQRVYFTNCQTNEEYPSDEPAYLPDDDIYGVMAGLVVEVNLDSATSTYGRYVQIQHQWPHHQAIFYSLYAHLDSICVRESERIEAGAKIGRMGQTSSSDEACQWMAIAPHLHFECWDEAGRSYDPAELLRRFTSH